MTVAVLLIATALPGAAQSRPARSASQPTSRDEVLWEEIQAANRALADTQPYSSDLQAARSPRRRLLELARVYLTSYPGGPRRDEVVRLELKALFEIGTLSGGEFEPLRKQVEEYLAHPPSEATLHEAAYWKIRCERLARVAAASQPSSAPVGHRDEAALVAYRDYIERYPRSRYVPRMVTELFDAATEAGNLDEQRRLVELLGREFKEHAVTRLLAAQLSRQEAVGKPFSLTFRTWDGTEIDTARWQGRPVLVVVWAGFCARCRASVPEIDAFRAEHPELLVVGVNLDESEREMTAACRELGLAWPQFNDGMGWANRFVRHWGVRRIPSVFVVDRGGRLVGIRGADAWRELTGSVLEN
ncbi:MAG: TlpA family protein disulfide reductase [Planctomycetes bacterium]|nr:TlpA family protein disulfide reductase [Planctomycetota bacterium]